MSDMLKDKKVVIIGLGLIGGSIARALSARNIAGEIVGVGRKQDVLQQAQEAGAITSWSTELSTACEDADLVILTVPSLTVHSVLETIKPTLPAQAVISDAASVKSAIVQAAEAVFGETPARFIPGHPIAGSEHSGFSASTADLFQGKKVILTPLEQSDTEAVELVTSLWEALGAEVLTMTVERHDEVLAATSHLPHLLAFSLVDTLSQQGESEEIFRYAAGGFRDFTRIASSDPQMWHDIFMANGPATVKILDSYVEDLQRLRKALLSGDSEELMKTFKRANKSRARFLEFFEKGGNNSA